MAAMQQEQQVPYTTTTSIDAWCDSCTVRYLWFMYVTVSVPCVRTYLCIYLVRPQVFIDSDDEVDRTRIQENQKRLAMLAEDAAKAAEVCV